MPIPVQCFHCRINLTLGDDRAGTEMDCPNCGIRFAVPTPPSPPPPSPPPMPLPPPPPSVRDSVSRYSGTLTFVGTFLILLGVVTLCLGVGVVIGGVGLLMIWYANDMISKHHRDVCPLCGEWEATTRIGSEVVEQEKCHGLVKRTSRTSSYGGMTAGPPIGPTPTWTESTHQWEERVPVVRTVHRHTFRCCFCGGVSEREEVTEVEDFRPSDPLPKP